jgi:hypothetical protein
VNCYRIWPITFASINDELKLVWHLHLVLLICFARRTRYSGLSSMARTILPRLLIGLV